MKEDIQTLSVGIVSSRFNNETVEKISKACISKLEALGVSSTNIIHISVPGALEIPIALKKLAEGNERFDVMVAIGLVIRGETYHFEIVANESARCLCELAIKDLLPIGNGILTVENEKQAFDRADPKKLNKGAGAALACLSLIEIKKN